MPIPNPELGGEGHGERGSEAGELDSALAMRSEHEQRGPRDAGFWPSRGALGTRGSGRHRARRHVLSPLEALPPSGHSLSSANALISPTATAQSCPESAAIFPWGPRPNAATAEPASDSSAALTATGSATGAIQRLGEAGTAHAREGRGQSRGTYHWSLENETRKRMPTGSRAIYALSAEPGLGSDASRRGHGSRLRAALGPLRSHGCPARSDGLPVSCPSSFRRGSGL